MGNPIAYLAPTLPQRRMLPVLALVLGGLAGGAAPALAGSVEASRANVTLSTLAPPEAAERACWARHAPRGGKMRNGVLEEVAFRVPCPEQVSEDFIRTLQRALAARGYFSGEASGTPDQATRVAVQAFQRDNGFDSPILTLETAQRLGLVRVEVSRN